MNAVTRIGSLLVLGGTSEIGVATATELARRGASKIILAGREPKSMSGAVAALKQAGAAEVEAVQFDATAIDHHGAFVDDVFDRFGDIDAVLIAFGVLGDQLAQEIDEAAAVETSSPPTSPAPSRSRSP